MFSFKFLKVFIITLLFLWSQGIASQHSIKGIVIDEEGSPLISATAVLLTKVDSTLVEFSMTNNSGQFLFRGIEKGDYLLQITYVGYNNYLANPEFKWSDKETILSPIILSISNEVLQEITIKAEHIPMGIRGDTLSYNAAAFKTRPNATVEELLKKLPGIEVDRDGSIKAQGKEVENVLVDGKEFFGTDHRIATQNLEAEAIDKVEVYDKKSEIAEFTGVDDGKEEKTINLKLKEDHKKGGFGNASLDGGNNQRYNTKLNYFNFTPAMQSSIIISGNNLNEQTFSFNEQMSFLGGMGAMLDNGPIQISGNRSNSDGINNALTSGLNLNYDFNPKLSFNSHYLFRYNDGIFEAENEALNFNDTRTFQSSESINQNTLDNTHGINSKVEYKPNPFFNLTSRNNFSWNYSNNGNITTQEYFDDNGGIGNALSEQLLKLKTYQIQSNNLFKSKFKKDGRSLISRINIINNERINMDSVYNYNFFGPEAMIIHQEQIEKNKNTNLNVSSAFSEVFAKNWVLSLSYSYNYLKNDPLRNFFDFVDGQKIINNELSSGFNNQNNVHNTSLSFKRNTKRLKLGFGAGYQYNTITGNLIGSDETFGNKSTYLLPNASLEYSHTGSRSFRMYYNTDINLPSLRQLTPIPDNTNPNALYLGNPELMPEYNHSLETNFNYFDQFNSVSFYGFVRYENVQNKIVNKIEQDEFLFRSISPVNSDFFHRITLYSSFSSPIRKLGIDIRLSGNTNYNFYESFINNALSNVEEQNYSLRMSIANRKTSKFLIETGTRIEYNIRKYEQFENFNQAYNNIDYFLETAVYLPKNFTINYSANYNTYSNAAFASPTNFLIMNSSIEKLLWNDKFTLSLRVKDMLNNNIGYRRNTTAFSLQEENFNALGRTFLIGLTYKIGKSKGAAGSVIMIED